jgi:Zn-finger nucleic acid-binding protein
MLVILEVEDVELDVCVQEHGLWFDVQELGQLFEKCGVPEDLQDLENRLEKLPRAGPRRACPRCRGRMESVRAPQAPDTLILDRCPRGHGLWFDRGELEALLACLLEESDEELQMLRDYLGHVAAPAEKRAEPKEST